MSRMFSISEDNEWTIEIIDARGEVVDNLQFMIDDPGYVNDLGQSIKHIIKQYHKDSTCEVCWQSNVPLADDNECDCV